MVMNRHEDILRQLDLTRAFVLAQINLRLESVGLKWFPNYLCMFPKFRIVAVKSLFGVNYESDTYTGDS